MILKKIFNAWDANLPTMKLFFLVSLFSITIQQLFLYFCSVPICVLPNFILKKKF